MDQRGRVSRGAWVDIVRLVPVLVVFLAPIAMSVDRGEFIAAASAVASCPDGVGRGGDTASSPADTRGGHGCIVFEYDGSFDTFAFTGSMQAWTVPTGVTSVVLHALGAGGGGGKSATTAFGGGGGYATGRLAVIAGQQFDVIVGEGGRRLCAIDVPPLSNTTARHNFSYGGGGAGNGSTSYNCSFAAGGGRSAVRVAGGTDDLITAGGGGGGGYTGAGGSGGGLAGGPGGGTGGAGGTQNAGGASASPEIGVAGIKYAGGWAGYSVASENAASEGGGGGGGYYGGGAAGDNGGGGGGSSYLGTLTATSTTAAVGRNAAMAVPTNLSPPTIPALSAIGSTIVGTAGSWGYTGEPSYKWQHSSDGSTYVDVSGESAIAFVPTEPGWVRLVETRSNFLGSTSATSTATIVPDTRLSSLSVSAGSLTPVFGATRTSYAVSVGYRTRSLRVMPTTSSGSAVVKIAGGVVAAGTWSSVIDLDLGDTTVMVRVEAAGVATETSVVVSRSAAAVPGAPTISSVIEGDGRLTIAFDPPVDDGGEAISRFEYSTDGLTWSALDGLVSRFDITDLSNGSTYDVRMRAVNAVGAGKLSPSLSAVPKKTVGPTTSTAPSTTVETVVTTTSTTTSSTIAATTTIERGNRQSRSAPTAPSEVTATSPTPPETTSTTTTVIETPSVPEATASSDPVTTTSVLDQEVVVPLSFELVPEFGAGDPAAGARVRAQATGLAPSSIVRLEVHSEPIEIGRDVTDETGAASLSATLPVDLESGLHMLVLSGTAPTGEQLVSVAGLEIGTDGVISAVTPTSGHFTAVPDEAQVERMVAANSAPYDASRDVGSAIALAGAAVVLMGLAAGGAGTRPSGRSTDGGEGSDDSGTATDSGRNETAEGSLASADAKVLQSVEGGRAAWGDSSKLWVFPGWSKFASVVRRSVHGFERWSTLVVRILQDGTWARAAFGVAAVLPCLVALVLGVAAAQSVGLLAVPPALGLVVAIVVLSFLDAMAGALAWLAFSISVVLNGGLESWFDLRTILGLGVLFVALPLIAASFRPIVRAMADGGGPTQMRFFDYLVVPAFVSYAGASVYQALNGLSGLSVVSSHASDVVRWLCLGLAVGRMLLEDATIAWFPERRAEASVVTERSPFAAVPYVNVCIMLCIYALTAGPYMGTGPRTWIVASLMCVVPLVKIHRDKLPNVVMIHRWLPRGILRSVIMLYAMAHYGRWITDATNGDSRAAVPLMLVPGIAIGLLDSVGRTGGSWPESRMKNVAGVILWAVSFSVVAGWLAP